MKLALSTKLCMAVCLWLCLSISAYAAKEVSLVFAGDTVLDDTAGKIIEQGGDPFSDFADYFAGADIRITNMECVVSTRGQANDKMYTFQAHPRVIPVLQKHFDAVTLANNHSGDFGPDAFAQMLSLLKEAGLAQVGGGMKLKQAHTPLVFTRNGLRIAVLSYNEFHPRSFEAGFDIPGVAWSEDQQVMEDIQTARRIHRADLVIPVMHWGWENERTANPRQRQLAKLMIDAGADAVIGGHPHVTQDVSVYKGKPIVYSVGNFVMKETDNAFQRKGWVLKMYFDKRGVTRFETLPVKIDMEGIPSIDRAASSPCWQRGDNIAGECQIAPAE